MLEKLCGELFEFVSPNFYTELLAAISNYASTKRGGDMAEKAVGLMKDCGVNLATGKVRIPGAKSTECFTEKYIHEWEGLTLSLIKTISTGHANTRRTALKVS